LWASKQAEPENMMSMRKESVIGFFVGGVCGFYWWYAWDLAGGFIIAPILM
jgi:hypothetical protein